MRKSLVSTALATALVCSSLAFTAIGAQTDNQTTPPSSSQMQHGKWHGMHHRRDHREAMGMLDKLDLTDTQRTNIRQMTRQNFEQARPAMQALMQKRQAFENATPGTTDYQTAATQLAQAEAQAAQARVTQQADLRTKIYNTLTPEQRTKLASLRAERTTRMQQWKAKHMQRKTAAPASAASSM